MSRIFKTRHFARWSRKAGIADAVLCKAVHEMEQGLIDADLGKGVVKKRVPLSGRGKSGGARTLVATNKDDRWFFVFGFEKSSRENIDAMELHALQMLAKDLLGVADDGLDALVSAEALQEISNDPKT